ncbi:MAG: pantetheine-phosphate adenylyltransferase [Bacteroidota bacterium]
MQRIALFPGSFDPITIGHVDLVVRASKLFDRVIVGVGTNSEKKYLFDQEKRLSLVQNTFKGLDDIEVIAYSGLTVDCCKKHQANYIIRGIRNAADYEYEKSISIVNNSINPSIETVFLLSKPEHASISSTIIRDIIRNGGDPNPFLPNGVRI